MSGKAETKRENPAAELKRLKEEARRGNPEAQSDLAVRCAEGKPLNCSPLPPDRGTRRG